VTDGVAKPRGDVAINGQRSTALVAVQVVPAPRSTLRLSCPHCRSHRCPVTTALLSATRRRRPSSCPLIDISSSTTPTLPLRLIATVTANTDEITACRGNSQCC